MRTEGKKVRASIAYSGCLALIIYATFISDHVLSESLHPQTEESSRSAKLMQVTRVGQASSSGVPVSSTLKLGLGFGTVGDRVDYTPNLPEGGFRAPVNKPRYQSYSLSAQWQGDSRLSAGGQIAKRNFTSLRDDFKFTSYRMDASVRLPAIAADTITSLDFSIGSNNARRLNKNSFTQIGDNLIKQVTVSTPRDLQWRASLSQNQKLTDHTYYTFFGGVGQTLSRHSGISGTGTDSSGCSYDFQFLSDGGTIDQRDVCGAVQTMNRVYPNELSIERDLGVAPQQDMQNNAWFYRVGGDLTADYGRWKTRLAFYHQRYVRDTLDNRIRSFGGEVYDVNNVVSLQATRSVSRKLSYSATLEYNQHQFLEELPVLYTRLTAHRFAGDVVHMTMRINYVFGR